MFSLRMCYFENMILSDSICKPHLLLGNDLKKKKRFVENIALRLFCKNRTVFKGKILCCFLCSECFAFLMNSSEKLLFIGSSKALNIDAVRELINNANYLCNAKIVFFFVFFINLNFDYRISNSLLGFFEMLDFKRMVVFLIAYSDECFLKTLVSRCERIYFNSPIKKLIDKTSIKVMWRKIKNGTFIERLLFVNRAIDYDLKKLFASCFFFVKEHIILNLNDFLPFDALLKAILLLKLGYTKSEVLIFTFVKLWK